MNHCAHCGEPIRLCVSWTSGQMEWVASIGYPLGEWPFCPAVNGGDHSPAAPHPSPANKSGV